MAMVTFQQLMDADPDLFEAVAARWEVWADEIDRRGDDLGAQVITSITDPAVWSGSAATAAGAHCDNLKQATHRATDKIRDIPPAYRAAGRGIGDAQYSAQQAVATVQGAGLVVDAVGAITGPDGGPIPPEHTGLAQEMADQITRARQAASEASSQLWAALQLETVDIADATEITAELTRVRDDALRAGELADLGADMTAEQQRELARLLHANADDATFATMLHHRLGPDGAFQLYTDLAAQHHANPTSSDVFARIQTGLGESLATATDTRNEPHVDDRWQREFDAAARRQYDVVGVQNHDPYGYQILGGLLQSGDYSPDFLDRVGDSLLDFENGSADVWASNQPFGIDSTFDLSLNDGATPSGRDPMVDLYRVLDDEPEAARRFLDPQDNPGRQQYLFNDREYHGPSGVPFSDPAGHDAYDALGEVLETATLEAPRDERSAAIVAEMVHILGGSAEPGFNSDTGEPISDGGGRGGDIPPLMRDSVAQVLGGYIADVNDTYRPPLMTAALLGYGTDDGPLRVGSDGSARMATADLVRVFDALAENPDDYRVVHDANTVYTALRMDELGRELAGEPYDVRAAEMLREQRLSSQVFGALAEARVHAVEEGAVDSQLAYEQQLRQGGALASAGVGVATGALTANPAIGAGAGGVANLFINEITEDLRVANADRLDAAARSETSIIAQGGYSHGERLAIQAMLDHHLYDPATPLPALPPQVDDWDKQDWADFTLWYEGGPYSVDLIDELRQSQRAGATYQQDFR